MLSRRLGMPFDSFGIIRWCTPRATRIFYFISSRINPTDQVRSAGKINHGTAWTKVSKNKGACRRMLKRNLYGGEILDRETSVSIPRGLGRSDESSGYWSVQRPFFLPFFFLVLWHHRRHHRCFRRVWNGSGGGKREYSGRENNLIIGKWEKCVGILDQL